MRITSRYTPYNRIILVRNPRNVPPNCFSIKQSACTTDHGNNGSRLPRFSTLNARSLMSKMDELSGFLEVNNIQIVAITGTWFHREIYDEFISIEGILFHRRYSEFIRGGGVCVYVSKATHSKGLADLEEADHEYMLIWPRPNRLLIPLPCVSVCFVYNPPDRNVQEQRDLCQYLIRSIDLFLNQYPDCGIVVLVDFNNLNIADLT